MKIRKGFVSNSSSSSFVCIGDGDKLIDIENEYLNIINDTIIIKGNFEFGWEFETFWGFEAKIAFAWMQAKYINDDKQLKMIEEVVKEVTGMNVKMNIGFSYDDNIDKKYNSYIDHQSVDNHGIFESKETLKNFLFDENSYIEMGNDNV